MCGSFDLNCYRIDLTNLANDIFAVTADIFNTDTEIPPFFSSDR